MDLSTTYLGFKLATPVIPGASPMCDDLTTVLRLEDAGAPMIIMHSVFQEQLELEELAVNGSYDQGSDSFPEASGHLPALEDFKLGPDGYLTQIARIKHAVSIPVIASINGIRTGWWIDYAKQIEEAGADGLELNIYNPVLDVNVASTDVERDTVALVTEVRKAVKFPLAVKLSSNWTAFGNVAKQVAESGVNALVLFNRFFQADIDIERLELRRELTRSTSEELLPRLSAVAALYGQINCDLAITGGIHRSEDVIKAVMVGASAVQSVTALLEMGPLYLEVLHDELANWLESHEYQSLSQMRGSMSLQRTPNRAVFERGNYMKILHSWERT